jgi:hypothetical protein
MCHILKNITLLIYLTFVLVESEEKEQEPIVESSRESIESTSTFSYDNLNDLLHSRTQGPGQTIIRIEQNLGTTNLDGIFHNQNTPFNLSNLLSGLVGRELADQIEQRSLENIVQQIHINGKLQIFVK